jgi:hypothetical protein
MSTEIDISKLVESAAGVSLPATMYESHYESAIEHPESPTEDRTQKSRERNREHAKRTRLRKKAVLEVMKDKLLSLQNEVGILF